MALLRLAVLKLSLWESGATYGSALQNLRYRNEGRHAKGRECRFLTLCGRALTHAT